MADLYPIVHGEALKVEGVLAQEIDTSRLLCKSKWDYLLSHSQHPDQVGFVPLASIAETRRGIATGANKFFHVPYRVAENRGIRRERLLICIGRAADVYGLVFRASDFASLRERGAKTHLINLGTELSEAEKCYVEQGREAGLHERYLLAKRNPWYSMERRAPAPIWAAVFGRKALRFIYNEKNAHNLTTFHCIYPTITQKTFVKALVASLNSRRVQELSKQHQRVYGGGLAKFEPRDLLDIQVPDLTVVSQSLLKQLSSKLDELDSAIRSQGREQEEVMQSLDLLVNEAAVEASRLGNQNG